MTATLYREPALKWKRAYACIIGRDKQKEILAELTALLKKHCKPGFSEHRTTGDDGGGSEDATITHYQFWNECDKVRGQLQTYIVIDDSMNGSGVCVSLLYHKSESSVIDGDPDKIPEEPIWLSEFIQKWDMANNHKHFRSRPDGWHTFFGYLDEPYYPERKHPFCGK